MTEIRNTNGEPRPVRVNAHGNGLIEIRHEPRAASRKAHLIVLTRRHAIALANALLMAAEDVADDAMNSRQAPIV